MAGHAAEGAVGETDAEKVRRGRKSMGHVNGSVVVAGVYFLCEGLKERGAQGVGRCWTEARDEKLVVGSSMSKHGGTILAFHQISLFYLSKPGTQNLDRDHFPGRRLSQLRGVLTRNL